MTTLLYTHPACLEHDPGPYHPESPERLRAILEALEAPEFARLERREAPEAAIEDLARVHPRPFVERLLAAVPHTGHVAIDADTVMSPASGRAALRAAGAVTAAVDAVVAGEADNAFCAVRPPGHHAEPGRPMGFCLFNNIANVPLRPMSGSTEFRLAMTRTILPALDAFRPEILLISAGFDAHRSDPLAQLALDEGDYVWV